jgi:hypothetical protein
MESIKLNLTPDSEMQIGYRYYLQLCRIPGGAFKLYLDTGKSTPASLIGAHGFP